MQETNETTIPDAFVDATTLAARVRDGEVAPEELVEQAIERIEAVDGEINSVIVKSYEKARAEAKAARGPFAGVPYLLKDTMASKGDLYTAGLNAVKQAGYRATEDAFLVERMRAAGFVLVGKSNMPELALSTTESDAWGLCRNPWNLDRSVGGSSGGAGAAVAAGLVPVAHGSDGGGSVRFPASMCGVVGIKPTRGRLTQGPEVIDSDNNSGMAHEGFFSRSVRDIAALLDVVGGRCRGDVFGTPAPRRPYVEEVGADPGRLRIGVCTIDPAGEFEVHPECVASTRNAADVLANLGHEVADSYPESIRRESWPPAFLPCVAVVVLRELERFGRLIGRELTEDDVMPHTWAYAEMGKQVTGAQYAAGIDAMRETSVRTESWWEVDGWDLWLTPVRPIVTAPVGLFRPTKEDPFGSLELNGARYTVPFNVSGQPAISLPLHWTEDGMPLGVQLVAAYGREDVLLRVAAQLEEAMPWAHRIPPVHA